MLSRYHEKQIQDAYQSYIADAIRIITENTAHLGGGSYLKQRWAEVINPKPPETRTPEEIKDHMKDVLNKLSNE